MTNTFNEIGSTPRTQRLKQNLISKACYNGKYTTGIYVDIDRAKLFTDSHKENEMSEPAIKRAKGLYHVLTNIPIAIYEDELLVGNPHADPYALPIFPEINVDLLSEALAEGYVKEKDRTVTEDLIKYWRGKTLFNKVAENMSAETRAIVENQSSFISNTWRDGIQHCVPNWDYTFANGTKKIREKIKAKHEKIFNIIDKENSLELSDLINKKYEYEAMLISLDALDIYLERYAKLALEKAASETNPERAKELKHLATILNNVLKIPPQSFHEACQGFYFLHLILNCIDSAAFGSLCRIDQCLWPFYKRDVIKNKTLTQVQAQELIECLILKVQALGSFFAKKRRLHFEGNGALPIWTVGGLLENGKDACNELTEVILKAARSIRCNQPTISIIYHPKMRKGAIEEAIKTVRSGIGYPSFTNAKWMLASLKRQGIPLEAARNSGVVGCVSVCPVDSCNTTKRLALEIIAAKCLELALNEGKCLITNKVLGPEEKPASEFKTFKQVMQALNKQLAYAFKTAVNVRNITRHFEMRYRPNPLASAFHRSSLETGVDVVRYEDYPNNYWLNMVGLINVVNSLAVIKKLVFEQKKYSMNDIIGAMKNNWDGLEAMRQEVINKVPKFGNDDPYVDRLANEIFENCSTLGEHTYDINGGYWSILAQSVSIYQATSKLISALPDGKVLGKPLADGGVSPDHGTDKNGVFSVISSVGALNHTRTKGLLLNQWIAPELLEGQEGIDWMKAMLELWSEKGISQVQFNVVDPKVLRAAQVEPEKYPHLTVRVSGYTANWIKLTRDLQEMILARTMQTR